MILQIWICRVICMNIYLINCLQPDRMDNFGHRSIYIILIKEELIKMDLLVKIEIYEGISLTFPIFQGFSNFK